MIDLRRQCPRGDEYLLLPSQQHEVPEGLGDVQIEGECPAVVGPVGEGRGGGQGAVEALGGPVQADHPVLEEEGKVLQGVEELVHGVVEHAQETEPGVRVLQEEEGRSDRNGVVLNRQN